MNSGTSAILGIGNRAAISARPGERKADGEAEGDAGDGAEAPADGETGERDGKILPQLAAERQRPESTGDGERGREKQRRDEARGGGRLPQGKDAKQRRHSGPGAVAGREAAAAEGDGLRHGGRRGSGGIRGSLCVRRGL
jgi:hypothetical protein